jgi:peptidoglycan/LPS O-acetylase OafA/YrhL
LPTGASAVQINEQGAPASPQRLHSLDGLRGLLALQVVAFHYLSQFPNVLEWSRSSFLIIYNGNYAVCMFFMLSGFVMSHVYAERLGQTNPHGALVDFFGARVARLVPVHLFALAVLVIGTSPLVLNDTAFLKPDTSLSIEGLVASIFSVQGPWFDRHSWNYPSWSISVEWHLYVIFPLVVWLVLPRRLGWPVIALGVAIPALYVLSRGGSGGAVPSTGGLSLLLALCLFLAGMGAQTVWR